MTDSIAPQLTRSPHPLHSQPALLPLPLPFHAIPPLPSPHFPRYLPRPLPPPLPLSSPSPSTPSLNRIERRLQRLHIEEQRIHNEEDQLSHTSLLYSPLPPPPPPPSNAASSLPIACLSSVKTSSSTPTLLPLFHPLLPRLPLPRVSLYSLHPPPSTTRSSRHPIFHPLPRLLPHLAPLLPHHSTSHHSRGEGAGRDPMEQPHRGVAPRRRGRA